MSGVKGRSGRKSWSEEERIHYLRRQSVETTIKFLGDKAQPLLERAKIAAQHSVREIKDKSERNNLNPDKIIIAYGNKDINNRIPPVVEETIEDKLSDAGKLT